MPLPKPQLRLSTLLVLMLLAGVLFAWYADHRRQQAQLQQLAIELRMQAEQITALQQRVNEQNMGVQVWYYWANADNFIEVLKQAEENKFLEMAPSFARSDEAVFKDGIERVLELLGSETSQDRTRAITVISFMLQGNRKRMQPFTEAAVAKLTPLVNDPDSSAQGSAIGVLGTIGPPAKPALPELKKIMLDDNNHYAPAAARVVAQIDPNTDIGPRLIELIERKHRDWYGAAFILHKHVPADVARRVISARFKAAENDSERNMAVQALNQIEVEMGPLTTTLAPTR